MTAALDSLQSQIGHHFKDVGLLKRALTHRSFGAAHYERLEFLGDTVVNLVVSHLLYKGLPNEPEGQLSRIRANLVKQESLHQLALQLGLQQHLLLGEGEAKSGGSKRPSILADALEAVIGAIYLDAGFDTAKALVERLFQNLEISTHMAQSSKDGKTELQEWLQSKHMPLPVYTVISTLGAQHEQSFDVECSVPSLKKSERGIGGTRRAAEQAAASAMMQTIHNLGL